MSVTLADVAEACQLSPSTVSRALSDPGSVSLRTRRRVQAAVREKGYIPNLAARSLSVGRTGSVGLIVPDIGDPLYPPLIKAVQERASQRDNAVSLAETAGRERDEVIRAREMSRYVDGLILIAPRATGSALATLVGLSPTIVVDRSVDGTPSVVIDNAEGINQAVEHLAALGHRKICYLAGPRRSPTNRVRSKAVAAACRTYSVEMAELGPFEPHVQAGARAGDLLEASHATAAIAFDDLIALGLMARLAERGMRVGRDISVVGIDDSPMSGMVYPTLTSIHVPGPEACAAAIDLLLGLLDDGVAAPTVEFETHLVIRGSTGPAPQPGVS